MPCAEADVEGEKDASPAEQAGGRGRPAGTGFRKERLQLVEGLSPHPPLRAPWETAGVAHLSAPGRLAWVTHPIPGHTLRRAGKVKHTSGPFSDVKLPQGTQHLLHPTVPIQPQGSCGDQQPREKLREPTLPLNHAAKDTEARRGRRRCPSPMASLSLLLGRGTAPQPP